MSGSTGAGRPRRDQVRPGRSRRRGGHGPGIGEPAYVGEWTQLGRIVWVEAGGERRPLVLGDDHRSRRRYLWGRPGPGAKAVARAILLHATENPALAERLSGAFTWQVLARLSPRGFRLTRPQVQRWVEAV
jgi:hypothetical protein